MKIKFDFGTQKNIPDTLVATAINLVMKSCVTLGESNNIRGIHIGRCTVYLSLFDDDGLEKIIANENREELNYLFRSKEYVRTPKNTKLISILRGEDPEDPPPVYVYAVYSE